MATQNPVDQEGTYPLPEAQVDRFMLKVVIDYPKMEDERLVIRQNLKGAFEKVNQVVSIEQILRAQEAVREVYMDEKIEKYILDIIFIATIESFKKNFHRLYLSTLSTNIAAQGLYKNLGFMLEGIQRDAIFRNNEYVDLINFGLINTNSNKF